jgi:hypothetical protein
VTRHLIDNWNIFVPKDAISTKIPADWWKTMFDEFYLLTDARSIGDKSKFTLIFHPTGSRGIMAS